MLTFKLNNDLINIQQRIFQSHKSYKLPLCVSRKMKKITIIFLLFLSSVYGQNEKNMSINGNLKVLFGFELLTPDNPMMVLDKSYEVATIDSLGNYTFSNLKKGIYNIQVLDYNVSPEKFEFELKTESITDFNIIVTADCEVTETVATEDIKKGKPRLLLAGGIAPVIEFGQEKFEKEYGVEYYEYGCISPPAECMSQYNKVIFEYLTEKYGRKWKRKVRKDVIGL